MIQRLRFLFINSVALLCVTAFPLGAETLSFNGFLGVGSRTFSQSDSDINEIHSLSGELRSRGAITDSLTYTLRLYGRTNLNGLNGGYFDPTVAKLTYSSDNWQIDAGYDLVFWGVTEGRNVVNIINQRDQIRDPFFDQGLGQSMIAARYFGSALTLEAFILPHFEELNFGAKGRPWGLGLPVNDDHSTFESADGANHIDYALRVSGTHGNFEYAAFAFDGTLRTPELQFDPSSTSLAPNYILGQQLGFEAQYTSGATLLKLESVRTWPKSKDSYTSTILGIEHTVGDIFGLPAEASLFAEYNHDSRQNDSTVLFQNDVFLGTQLRFSNRLDTQVDLGAFFDLEYGGVIGSLRMSSRVTESLRAKAEFIYIDASDSKDSLSQARDFDQVSIGLEWHF